MPAKKSAIGTLIYHNRNLTMTRNWDKLSAGKQSIYLDKARILIDHGYVHGKSEEQLAKEIYEKE